MIPSCHELQDTNLWSDLYLSGVHLTGSRPGRFWVNNVG
jgi:hypothetical protein